MKMPKHSPRARLLEMQNALNYRARRRTALRVRNCDPLNMEVELNFLIIEDGMIKS